MSYRKAESLHWDIAIRGNNPDGSITAALILAEPTLGPDGAVSVMRPIGELSLWLPAHEAQTIRATPLTQEEIGLTLDAIQQARLETVLRQQNKLPGSGAQTTAAVVPLPMPPMP